MMKLRLTDRQWDRLIGTVVLALSIATLTVWLYFTEQDEARRRCLADNFRALSVSLEAERALTERETAANRRINLAELNVDSDAEYLAELKRYDAEVADIEAERKANPVPPYPAGECQ